MDFEAVKLADTIIRIVLIGEKFLSYKIYFHKLCDDVPRG